MSSGECKMSISIRAWTQHGWGQSQPYNKNYHLHFSTPHFVTIVKHSPFNKLVIKTTLPSNYDTSVPIGYLQIVYTLQTTTNFSMADQYPEIKLGILEILINRELVGISGWCTTHHSHLLVLANPFLKKVGLSFQWDVVHKVKWIFHIPDLGKKKDCVQTMCMKTDWWTNSLVGGQYHCDNMYLQGW